MCRLFRLFTALASASRRIFAPCVEFDSCMALISNARGIECAATVVRSPHRISHWTDIPIFVSALPPSRDGGLVGHAEVKPLHVVLSWTGRVGWVALSARTPSVRPPSLSPKVRWRFFAPCEEPDSRWVPLSKERRLEHAIARSPSSSSIFCLRLASAVFADSLASAWENFCPRRGVHSHRVLYSGWLARLFNQTRWFRSFAAYFTLAGEMAVC